MTVILKYDSSLAKHNAKEALKFADDIVEAVEGGMLKAVGDFPLYWSHELTILRLCQAVRCGRIKTNDIRIHAENGDVVAVDVNGSFITPWPTDLFELSFYCQFTKYDKICYVPGKSTFDPDTMEFKRLKKPKR